jgi:predicted SAM-dependent methyltransferase
MEAVDRYLNFGAGDPAEGWTNLDPSPMYRLPRGVHHILATLGFSKRTAHFRDTTYRYFRFTPEARLPFADASLDAVYCSHVVEHLPAGSVSALFAEFHRIVAPGGVVRVLVPDLQTSLTEALAAGSSWVALDEVLGSVPSGLSPMRAALEGFAGFPSSHRTLIVPDQLEKALADDWTIRHGLSYLESAIDNAQLKAVEREDRCCDAIIFEMSPK